MLMDGRLCWDDFFELVDGEIVELAPVIGDHGSGETNILTPLAVFSRKAGGKAFPSSTGFTVGQHFQQLRAPDVSYIGPARVQDSYPRFIHGAPDLAVEVLSRDQHTEAYAKPKVREYFEAGAQLVWLVDLNKKEVAGSLVSDGYLLPAAHSVSPGQLASGSAQSGGDEAAKVDAERMEALDDALHHHGNPVRSCHSTKCGMPRTLPLTPCDSIGPMRPKQMPDVADIRRGVLVPEYWIVRRSWRTLVAAHMSKCASRSLTIFSLERCLGSACPLLRPRGAEAFVVVAQAW